MRRRTSTMLVGLAACLPAGSAQAANLPLDYLRAGDLHVDLPAFALTEEHQPVAVTASVGDVDGDGGEDVAVVLDGWATTGIEGAWVSFSSKALPVREDASSPGWRGFRIVGRHLTAGLTGLGDVNGDGRAEVAVADDDGVAVVFGRSTPGTVDVREPGAWGFRISGTRRLNQSSGGTREGGSSFLNGSLADAGDQNGDGRPDLAVVAGSGVAVVLTPASPAGEVVDATDPGTGALRLALPAAADERTTKLSRAGDLDGDTREDLVVIWEEREPLRTRAVAAVSPAPGATTDLGTAAADGLGYEITVPGTQLEHGLAVGDQDGDGRRDLVLATVVPMGGRLAMVAHAPPLGVARSVVWPLPAEGRLIHLGGGAVIDVGDQDGDGRSDLATPGGVRLSTAGDALVPQPQRLGGGPSTVYGTMLVASVADANGDGRRELVTVVRKVRPGQLGPFQANWELDVFHSPPQPRALEVPAPTVLDDSVVFSGTFETGTEQAAAGVLGVELTPPGGSPLPVVLGREPLVPQGGRVTGTTRVSQEGARLVSGTRYAYRVLLENAWGLVGASAPGSFVYTGRDGGEAPAPPGPPAAAGVTPPLVKSPVTPKVRLVVGTRRANRLVGTKGRDDLRGLAGDDSLRALGGDDRLDGGTGDDRLDGGSGVDRLTGGSGNDRLSARDGTRDVVACGSGRRDVAVVDRRDRVTGCETVRRSR